MSDRLEVQHLRKQILDLRQQIAMRPVGVPMRPQTVWQAYVQIINGQLISSIIPVIQYAAGPLTLPTAYDPNTTTSYIAGIGNGYMYNAQGVQLTNKVLVLHNFAAMTDPLMAGDTFRVGPAIQVSVSGGGNVAAYPVVGFW